ncbi:MAG: hypothetical protein ACM3NQ_11225 [Bacteroidales bacterium]
MLRRAAFALLVLALLSVPAAARAQSSGAPKAHSHKGRVIGTIVGIAGGFALGVLAGIGAYDDAINSDQKVWTVATLCAAGGGIGGYLLGNAIDHRGQRGAVSKTMRPLPMPSQLPRLRRPPSAASPLAKGLFAPPAINSGT